MKPAPLRLRCPRLFVLACLAGLALPALAVDEADQRASFRGALAAASRPPPGEWKKLASRIDPGYPLYPYIELAALRQQIRTLDRAEVERFLARWPDTLPAADLREAYLRELARRGDWSGFRALYQPGADRDLQCKALQAQLAAGGKLDYTKDLDALWQGERALPDACAPVLRAARSQAALTDAQVWERIERGAQAGNADVVAEAAAMLTGAQRIAADRIVAALREPAATFAKAKQWADDARTRDALSYGLARHARRNSAATETAWADLQARFKWDAPQKNRILNALALYRSNSYSPDALARLKALPADADDDATREWRVRVALASGDFKETLDALERLSDEQKTDERWRYLHARVLDKRGRKTEAAPLFADVAREANYYGFLAADWIGAPYSVCPSKVAHSSASDAQLANQPDLARAFEFRELGLLAEARREWTFAMKKLDAPMQRLAADFAYRRGWYDRAVFAYSANPETQTLYEQRFPLGLEKHVRQEARSAGIDPAWAYAIIRAESAWMTDARSHADAYGLMQLLPGVAKQVAKGAKLPYGNAHDLFEPRYNIQLGTRFLGQMADQYQGSPWLASAAYNAGSRPVGRWTGERTSLEPDFFIETIPYKETREYVSRVLAFSVIYDWRMNGKVLALSSRMPKIGQPWRAPTDDTPRKSVTCSVPEPAAVPVAPAQ
jgi:soluble lytic murein transglycosylase